MVPGRTYRTYWSASSISATRATRHHSRPPGVARILHVLRGADGRFDPEVARDDVQRQVDAGSEPTGGRDAPAVHEAQAPPELDVGELLRKAVEEFVVRGRRNALQ